jgi:hypothetical protein
MKSGVSGRHRPRCRILPLVAFLTFIYEDPDPALHYDSGYLDIYLIVLILSWSFILLNLRFLSATTPSKPDTWDILIMSGQIFVFPFIIIVAIIDFGIIIAIKVTKVLDILKGAAVFFS